MGKPLVGNVERAETMGFRTKVNKEVFDNFKDCLAEYGYPLNVMLELFMKQYSIGKFELDDVHILKFKDDGQDVADLSTTLNKEIYLNFKDVCQKDNFFVKHVVTAFMEEYASGKYVLEYKKTKKCKH